MAAISALTLKEPILPISSAIDFNHLTTIKVEHKWTTNNNTEQAKIILPVLNDSSNKEMFLYVIDQFIDAAHNDRLHLSTGNSRYTKFRSVINGDVRMSWQQLSDARNNKTVDSFREDVTALIALYFSPSSYEDQREYMRSASKPLSMSCEALHGRLRLISQLSVYLPGSNNVQLLATDQSFKRQYFQLMPNAWKLKFIESGQTLEGDTYTVMSLVRFMAVQEAISKRKDSNKRKADVPSARGGRSFGRFGSRGRSRGRGPHGNYQQFNRPFASGHTSYTPFRPFLTPRPPFPSSSPARSPYPPAG